MTELYRTQRLMRQMRRAAMARGTVAIIDLGTTKVTCLVLRLHETDIAPGEGVGQMAGQSSFRIIGAATTRARGLRHGEIASMGEAERALRTVVQAAQKMAQVRVDHAILCLSGARPRSYGLTGAVPLGGRAVGDHDVAGVLAACDLPDIGAQRAVLHAQPVNFAVDQRSGLGDPRGQVGYRLTTDMHMLTVDAQAVQAILHCVRRCDLELAGLASSAYTSGIAALVEDEQKLGAACVDLGGGSTGISIFLRGHMIYADGIRLGGDHVTRDIGRGLAIPHGLAERIKTVHGGLRATGRDDRDMVQLLGETGDWEHDRREVSRSELIGIMRPRLEEILEEVRARLEAAGFDDLPCRKVVLTGGGSQIPGLPELAQHVLGHGVRLGRPLRVAGLPQAATGPGFAAAVGLCLNAANPQDEWWDFDPQASLYPVRSLRRAVRWFRENW